MSFDFFYHQFIPQARGEYKSQKMRIQSFLTIWTYVVDHHFIVLGQHFLPPNCFLWPLSREYRKIWAMIGVCVSHIVLNDKSQTSHRWTDGWRPSEIITYDGQWTSNILQKHRPWWSSKKMAPLTMVIGKEMKNHETPWKTTRYHENTQSQ